MTDKLAKVPASQPVDGLGLKESLTGLSAGTPVTKAPQKVSPVLGAAPVKAPVKAVAGSPGAAATDPTTQSALDLLKSTLHSWGLDSLYTDATNFVTQGYSADEITLRLADTDAYKTRFAGNAAREAKGLAVLSPAAYIGLEDSYSDIMRQYGLPAGFYDSKAESDNFIGNDVSATELDSRVQLAQSTYLSADNATKSFWQTSGLSGGDAIASILDPTAALPLVTQKATAATIGGAAANQGVTTTGDRAMQFAQAGVTLADAKKAYQDIATNQATQAQVAQRFGTSFGQTDFENADLLGDAAASSKQSTVNAEEVGLFGGHAGADAASLSVSGSY